jgi:hypothetical protein
MNNQRNIILGKGLDNLLFGSSRKESKTAFGEPDKIDRYSYDSDDLDNTEDWIYHDLGLSLNFDAQEKFKLGTIEISSEDYKLNGEILINKTKEEVISFARNHNFGEYESDDLSSVEVPDYELLSFDDVSLNLWFENGTLTEIQWFPFWLDDENQIWP